MCCALTLAGLSHAAPNLELQEVQTGRNEGQMVVNAQWQMEIPAALVDALIRGVPLFFVMEAELNRERWYFYDKRIALAERYFRLSYLPLSQRWRVTQASQPFAGKTPGVSLAQGFETLEEALQVIRRVTQWPIAPLSEIELDARHNLELRLRLDLNQLPRPLQIGLQGQSDWALSAVRVQRLNPEALR